MTTRKLYKYIGRNGSITSPIFLEDIKYIALVELKADSGFVLRDNNGVIRSSVIVHVDDQDLWAEVPADIND